ncbi:hypothetical protein SteCoe_32742 [Stentor coeruleus]|uniref:Uncharacterized protein n=1 Tax=Stentor coeruleus TaxID=5963 RepID=A0A1R2AYD2_9CILI|nr:hypothetical protein SteCoe_32742 [Stentor coeruleus]
MENQVYPLFQCIFHVLIGMIYYPCVCICELCKNGQCFGLIGNICSRCPCNCRCLKKWFCCYSDTDEREKTNQKVYDEEITKNDPNIEPMIDS